MPGNQSAEKFDKIKKKTIFQRGTAATGAILNDRRPDFLPADDTDTVRRAYDGWTCGLANPDMSYRSRHFESVHR